MMLTRDKKIGKSTYQIVKFPDGFRIQETVQGDTAVTPYGYTMETALQILNAFDQENMIMRSK